VFAVLALGLGAGVLLLATAIQLAEHLPPLVQDSQLFGALVRGYDLLEPLMIDHSSPRYLGLLGVGVGIYWLLPWRRWRQDFLLLYSALLVAALVPTSVLLSAAHVPALMLVGTAAAILVVHVLAHATARRRGFAVGGIVGIVLIYVSILALPALAGIRLVPESVQQAVDQHLVLQGFFLLLPLKAIHYLWDVAAGRAEACSLRTLALWMLFFPNFRGAPLERVQAFTAQMQSVPDSIASGQIGQGLMRVGVGALKGAGFALVSRYVSPERVWALPAEASVGQLWLAAYGYAIALYLVFSGSVDAMIGSSILLGYRLSENFCRPYRRFDVRDFWRGWNLTVSHWLRDYVYIPLGGSRRGNVYLNLLATMLVAGTWHALRANFMLWGAWHGLGLVASRYLYERRRRLGRPEPSLNAPRFQLQVKWVLGVFVTFHFVVIGWVFHHNGYAGIGAPNSLYMVARMFGLR
jgi:D-alanyl-lipoteichoic acid acyltransferase DltB (MBOAT superfamily)